LTLEVMMRCALVTMTFCFGSWSSTGAKFRAPLNWKVYNKITIRKWCM